MPFDALLEPQRPRLLADILADQGIMPVPLETLAAHRQAQLERFAPSFWYQHQAWLPVGLIGSVLCMALSGGTSSWLTLFWVSVMTLLIVFGVFRVSAGARWEERVVAAQALIALGVPLGIARLACELQGQAEGSDLILGELLQEQVELDPYLVLRYRGERVCLGIWDGGRVLAVALPTG
jgi:lysylphosphatidylglycerol synthetase-like protein (DUF2156 family)